MRFGTGEPPEASMRVRRLVPVALAALAFVVNGLVGILLARRPAARHTRRGSRQAA